MSLAATATSLPYFHLGSIDTGIVPIQSFGILVALGLMLGLVAAQTASAWVKVSGIYVRMDPILTYYSGPVNSRHAALA